MKKIVAFWNNLDCYFFFSGTAKEDAQENIEPPPKIIGGLIPKK
jgi:hypothetical protein